MKTLATARLLATAAATETPEIRAIKNRILDVKQIIRMRGTQMRFLDLLEKLQKELADAKKKAKGK